MGVLDLSSDIKDFLYRCEFIEGKSINTIKSLKVDLYRFSEYILKKREIKEISDIDSFTFREFLIELQEEKLSKNSVNRKISSLKTFFKYLKSKEKIEVDLAELIEPLNYDRKRPDILTVDEIRALREAIQIKNSHSFRDRLIVELLYSSGITAKELLSLGEELFDLEKQELRIGKRVVYFSTRTKHAFYEYVEIKQKKLKDRYRSDILFTNGVGTRITDRSLRRVIERYRVKAKIDKDVTPHTFRHTFALHMLENGMDEKELQKLLGYSSLYSLKVYLEILEKQ